MAENKRVKSRRCSKCLKYMQMTAEQIKEHAKWCRG